MKHWRHILLTTTTILSLVFCSSKFASAQTANDYWLAADKHWRLVILTVLSIISICSGRSLADNMHSLTQLS